MLVLITPGQMVVKPTPAASSSARRQSEHVDRRFGGAVRAHRAHRRVRRHRCDVDDVAAGAAVDQSAGEGAAAVDHAAEVDVEHPIELLGRVSRNPGHPDARVVDHDVGHTVRALHTSSAKRSTASGVGHVQHIGVRDAPMRGDPIRRLLHRGLVDIADDQFGAVARERQRKSPADAAAGARHRNQHVAERFSRPTYFGAQGTAGKLALEVLGQLGDGGCQHLGMGERRPVPGLDVAPPQPWHPPAPCRRKT